MSAPEPDPAEVDRLFRLACDLAPGERTRVLEREPVEPSVRALVERLLRVFDEPSSVLDAGVAAPLPLSLDERPERIGPYAVLGLLGSGGMGVVYLAEQRNPARRVAIKVLQASLSSGERARRFEREAELLGRLQHRGIAQIIESGRTHDGPTAATYIAMEYVEGHTIVDFARERGLDRDARVGLLAELAVAVHHAHLRGVVHRDLKPGNVLVTHDGQVKVIDFGVARALDAGRQATLETMAGQVVGTLAYMAPEQVRGDVDRIDARADVYALGAIAYELLAGRLPHELADLSISAAARVLCDVEPPRLGAVAPACRGDLELVVAKALAKEPERRYQSAQAFAADLERCLRDEPIEARPASAYYQLRKIARRHRALVGGAAATLAAVLVGLVVAVQFAVQNASLARRELAARAEAEQRTAEANRLALLAEERAREIVRRTDPDLIVVARERVDELWPAVPERVPAMDAWLATYAAPLLENRAFHEASLAELRALALPYDEQQRAHDRATHRLLPELEQRRAQLEAGRRKLAGEEPGIPTLREREREMQARAVRGLESVVADLERRIDERTTWRLPDPELQLRHDHLARLVDDLREFFEPEHGPVASLRSAREYALRLPELTVTGAGPAAEWEAARAEIRALPVYDGLELAPQLGLRPLGVDPRSGLYEFWHVPSGARPLESPDLGATSRWVLAADTGMVFVLIPGGACRSGAQAGDPGGANHDPFARASEGPVVERSMPPFFLSKFEMTQGQWLGFTGAQPSAYGPAFVWFGEPPSPTPLQTNTMWNPVEHVTWLEAERVLGRLALRLPDGLEWEYAARGGTDTPWWTGPDPEAIGELPAANLADGFVRERGGPRHWQYEDWLADGCCIHAPVGSFEPNPFGLHDVIGNVWEWCRDELEEGIMLVRGGAFDSDAFAARVTFAGPVGLETRQPNLGLRAARSLD